MLNKPRHGWTDIEYNGTYLGCASYLDNVPLLILTALYERLVNKTNKFEVSFDAEGYYFGLSEIFYGLYAWKEGDNLEIISDDLCIGEDGDIDNIETVLRNISKEVISDIEENFEDWSKFCVYVDKELDKESYNKELQENTRQLQEALDKLKEQIDKPYHEMELGNMIFGHSRGKYPIPRGEWQDKFGELLTLGFDSYGHITSDILDKKYGKTKESKEGPIKFMDEEYTPYIHYFDNGTFMLNAYYWGDEEDLIEFPNFIYYPINYQMNFYKYPLRDSYANQELTYKQFCDMIDKCKESLVK